MPSHDGTTPISRDRHIIARDKDGKSNILYNIIDDTSSTVEINDNGKYLLDIDGDGKGDYIYDPVSGESTTYEIKEPKEEHPIPILLLGIIIVIIVVILLFAFLFKKGFFYFGKKE